MFKQKQYLKYFHGSKLLLLGFFKIFWAFVIDKLLTHFWTFLGLPGGGTGPGTGRGYGPGGYGPGVGTGYGPGGGYGLGPGTGFGPGLGSNDNFARQFWL